MSRSNKKKWTILIYANGNNELEPEMCSSISRLKKIVSIDNVNIVFQLARINRDIVKTIRPLEDFEDFDCNWTGVRRFCVEKKNCTPSNNKLVSTLIEDLGQINMSDSKTLYDFIKWGMDSYPAEHYMLILGGHGFLYLGSMTDYTQKLPCIMGIPEMSNAISMASKASHQKIDVLVLDTCNMNFVEIMYELAKNKDHCPLRVITYIQDGPIAGIRYNKLISIIENCNSDNLNDIITQVINGLNYDLVGINLNTSKLKRIKQLSNELGRYLFENSINEYNIFSNSNKDDNIVKLTAELKIKIQSLIIHHKRISTPKSNLINLAINVRNTDIMKVLDFYSRLAFSKANLLTTALGLAPDQLTKLNYKPEMKAEVLPVSALYKLIMTMNSSLDVDELQNILQNLIMQRNWSNDMQFIIQQSKH